ncbi:MAG: hypothetical protein ACRDOC_07470 [Streptosporangiaceae bacterium]
MSAHGHRGSGSAGPAQQGPGQFGWALLVIAMALIGGLAAATLVDASLLIAIVVSVVIGAVGAVVVLRLPAREPELTAPRTATMPRAHPRAAEMSSAAPPPESYPPDPVAPVTAQVPAPGGADGLNRGAAPAVNDTVVQMLPLGTEGAADAPWWDSAHPAPAPSAGAKRAPAPDLSTYLASTFIAQCPRCGAFRLDIRRGRSSWNFRCEACENTWTWQPGTPWPPVRVMPP